MGEIDIIAKDHGYLVFIEVKYRRDKSCGHPAEAVTPRKQRTISKVASYYLLTHGCGMDTPCRFDVAAVSGDGVELIKNAFWSIRGIFRKNRKGNSVNLKKKNNDIVLRRSMV